MRIGIFYNPISGRGKAARAAARLRDTLSARGHDVALAEARAIVNGDGAVDRISDRPLASFESFCVVGGDGTVMSLLPVLQRTRVPFLLVPFGNESLFARQFSMSRVEAEILRRIDRGTRQEHFVGNVNGKLFFTMVSVGLDADVIADIHRHRSGPIGHLGYVLPTIRNFRTFVPPVLSLEVDGRVAFDGEPGYLVIANTPQYARSLNPVPEADSSGRDLCCRFYNGGDRAFYLRALARVLTGRSRIPTADSRLFRGREFTVRTKLPVAVQADGEPVGPTPAKVTREKDSVFVLV